MSSLFDSNETISYTPILMSEANDQAPTNSSQLENNRREIEKVNIKEMEIVS